MGYYEISHMAGNEDLASRVRACAIQERPDVDPYQWTANNLLQLCTSAGWDEAWTSAEAAKVESPGRDTGVISDEMILSATQPLIALEPERARV